MPTDRQQIVSAAIAAPRGHFSHAVVANGTVYVAGLLPFDEGGNVVAPGDIEAQTERIFEILSHILSDAGSSLTETVMLTTYVTDIAQRAPVNAVRARRFGDCIPASTLVEVSGLAAAGAVIEVDAIAVVSTPGAPSGTARG